MRRAILVVGAHAGDIEARAAGVLAKYLAAGYDGHYVVVTNSNSGLYIDKNGKETYRYSEDMIKVRRAQVEKAAAVLGLKPVFLDYKESVYTTRDGQQIYPDVRDMDFGKEEPSGGEPISTATMRKDTKLAYGGISDCHQQLKQLFTDYDPHLTIIQEPDFTIDHHVTFNKLYMAYKEYRSDPGRSKDCTLLVSTMYPMPVKSLQRKPNVFFDVSKYMDTVEKAALCFTDPLSRCAGTVEHNLRVRREVAQKMGYKSGGEAFYQVHGPKLGPPCG